MKINKWTLGLAAVGLVSLASVAKAEETTTPLLTALSSTTVSGYVDVSAQWNPGTGTGAPAYAFSAGKNDGFNLNSVNIVLEKPLEEGEWSAGYKANLMLGPDGPAVTGGGPIREAYVALRVPVGNGLDFKFGQWDTIIGYEATDSYKNPNFTRSYGYTLTPTEHTGILATYQALEYLSLNVGIANTAATLGSNTRNASGATGTLIESHKAYMASITINAPDSWGFLSGSALYAGVLNGFGGPGADLTDYYFGATIKTPIEGLGVGGDFNFFDDPAGKGTDAYTTALYASFKATEKLGLHLRGEYGSRTGSKFVAADPLANGKVVAATATIQYDLWDNVLSRLEFRWDHDASGSGFRPFNGKRNDYAFIANVVYKF